MNDLDHLRTVIRRTEDTLLKSKDPHYIELLRVKLRKLRIELQHKEWLQRERESLLNGRLYFFSLNEVRNNYILLYGN